MGNSADSQDILGYTDQNLQHSIRTGDMPFLGLYSRLLDEKIQKALHILLQRSKDPLSQYLVYLHHWPAISLTYLTIHVCERFGSTGTFAVYPFIQEALQLTTPLTNVQRNRLWEAYRKACIRLGLSVSSRFSGPNFMVDEYLRQSGVPTPFVDDLTDRMLQYAKVTGIPDDDDPIAIKRWQDGLSLRLLSPFSKVASRAIILDDNGYYVRLFLNLLDKPADPTTALSDFELRMSDAIHRQQIAALLRKKGKSLSIAQVLWRDNQLGVELPPGEGTEWEITIENETTNYIGQIESRFIPFDNPLPPSVEIAATAKVDGSRFKTKLWEDDRNNRLLVFSSSGIFVHSSKLNEEPLSLEPGDYQFVLRFIPEGFDELIEEVRIHPSLYLLPMRLKPDQEEVVLRHGPASLKLHVDRKPILLWDGVSIKGIRGNEIYCGNDLKLQALIPQEFFVDGTKYYIRFSQSTRNDELIAQLSNHQNGAVNIDVSELIENQWKPGVTRVLAELYREKINRPVCRSSIMVWIGLGMIKNQTHFYCSSLPTNLIEEECDNLYVNKDQALLHYRNEDNRYFRMVFNLGDAKRFIFALSVPGIFMQLKDYSASTEIEHPLTKGNTLSIAWNSRKVLEVSSTSRGFLRLGDFNTRLDFSKRLNLAGLVGYLGPEVHTLQFIDEENGIEEDLLHLVSPHEIIAYSVAYKSNLYRIRFSLSQEVSEVTVKATDLLSGTCETLLFGSNSTFELKESGMRGWLTCESPDQKGIFDHDLRLSLDAWPNGAWIIDLDAKINGRWGKFSNARGDKFSAGFIMLDGKISTNALSIVKDYKEMDADAKVKVLRCVNERMLSCYALESWKDMSWIEDVWYGLISEFRGQVDYAPELLLFSEQPTPEEASSSWIPMRMLTAYCPNLYALPVKYFSKLTNTASFLIKCLSTMSRMKYGLLPLFHEGVLNQIFAFGYQNVGKIISQGEKPSQFNMKEYKNALMMNDLTNRIRLLRQEDWLPGDGDYLGALHYLYALGKLEERYQDTLTGNQHRRGTGLFLCRAMQHYPIPNLPTHLSTGITHLGYFTQDDNNLTDMQQFIMEIAQFLSLFAKICRWAARNNGCLSQFITCARSHVEGAHQLESTLGYLLYIGKEIFGFYLMLWEAVLRTDYDQEKKYVPI